MKFFNQIKHHALSIPGFRTKKKLVIIESDDWGAQRIPNKNVRDILIEKGLISSKNKFNYLDTLESKDDLTSLYDLLQNFKDKNGNSPILTANFLTANPDFNKIKESDYTQYFCESIVQTYIKTSADGSNMLDLIKVGIDLNLIRPQFHGREHVNVNLWMNQLRKKDSVSFNSFDLGVYCLDDLGIGKRSNLMASFDLQKEDELAIINKIFVDGFNEFERIFGFKSKSFIAPCYVWGKHLENTANNHGVKIFQGIYNQYLPNPTGEKYQLNWHFNGEQNKNGQYYFVRNAFMEVFENNQIDHVSACLKRMEIAFTWGKPAIIGMHRVNFVGGLELDNRQNTHRKMGELFKKMLKKWPDIEFISTDQLINYI